MGRRPDPPPWWRPLWRGAPGAGASGWDDIMKLLPLWDGRDVPDGRDLCFRLSAVYEVVVEGVARSTSLARPKECLVGMGEGCVQGVRRWVWFRPRNLVRHLSK